MTSISSHWPKLGYRKMIIKKYMILPPPPPPLVIDSITYHVKGGAVALLYEEAIKCIVCPQTNAESFEHLTCDITTFSRQLRITILYRPPTDADKRTTSTKFLEEFPDYLESLSLSNTGFIVAGHFNFHWDNSTSRNIKSDATRQWIYTHGRPHSRLAYHTWEQWPYIIC
mgnify:CR=1 FL=1